MVKILFDDRVEKNNKTEKLVASFLERVITLETKHKMAVIIFQDGASRAHYIKCSLMASDAASLCDLDAKLDVASPDSYRTNRQLFLKHQTYQRMEVDAIKGREFNDVSENLDGGPCVRSHHKAIILCRSHAYGSVRYL